MATVQHGQSHGDLHDDDSLLDDDLIDADDGEYYLPIPDFEGDLKSATHINILAL